MIIEYDPAKNTMPDCGGVPGSTHYQVVLLSSDGQLINQEVPREELIDNLGRLGYENHGIHREDGPLKGLPAFTGLIGPLWGG